MKKLIAVFLCLIFVLPLAVHAQEAEPQTREADPQTPEHTHSWNTETVRPTCTQPGSTTQTCSGCGETSTQTIPAAGHSWGGWTNGGSGSHSRSCSVCGASESAGHSWGEGQVTSPASCTATGTRVYTCVCGASQSETLPITDHTYGAWTAGETSHTRTCACGKTESASHSWDVSATVPATCLEEGATAYGCSTCGAITYEILPKLTTHTYDNVCDPDCNVCGAVREASHKFSTQWTKNAKGHWYACTACGAQKDFGSHYPGPAATEEKAQLCLTCGYTLTAKLGHTHKYETQWTSDETGHWYACSGCDDQKDFQEHSYDGSCDPDCNVCGYTTSTAHSYSGTWLCDEEGHWDVCTLCQEASEKEPHIPGPDATDKAPQLCTACGYELTPVQETVHVHDEDGQWQADEEAHWKVCTCGQETVRAAHAWGDGTEQEDSTVRYVCQDCGAVRTEGTPQTGINPLVWIGIAVIALIGIAVAALFLLIPMLKKGGRYKK